ncbi:hypothetical protein BDV93DRAFT_355326 [Ceratobasidium sp. AG-I]|nr:hypothetical protein BDV93DRAFT_355326 [Ceratobasidium sp. AG-I]
MGEFARMRVEMNWGLKGRRFKDAKKGFRKAMVLQFGDIYGMDKNDLPTLQNLLSVIRVPDTRDKVSECKKILKSEHVNICDLVDAPVTKIEIIRFANTHDLSAYTFGEQKVFPPPNGDGYEGSKLINLLRRQLLNRKHFSVGSLGGNIDTPESK